MKAEQKKNNIQTIIWILSFLIGFLIKLEYDASEN